MEYKHYPVINEHNKTLLLTWNMLENNMEKCLQIKLFLTQEVPGRLYNAIGHLKLKNNLEVK